MKLGSLARYHVDFLLERREAWFADFNAVITRSQSHRFEIVHGACVSAVDEHLRILRLCFELNLPRVGFFGVVRSVTIGVPRVEWIIPTTVAIPATAMPSIAPDRLAHDYHSLRRLSGGGSKPKGDHA